MTTEIHVLEITFPALCDFIQWKLKMKARTVGGTGDMKTSRKFKGKFEQVINRSIYIINQHISSVFIEQILADSDLEGM